MKGEVVNLNRQKWLSLANTAIEACVTLKPDHARMVGEAAGRMQSATPPSTDPVAMTGCLAFRWACQHFAFAPEALRPTLAPALTLYANEVRRIFDHVPAPAAAVSQPVPRQAELDIAPPRWTERRDITG